MTSKQEEAIDEYLRSIGLDPQPNPDEAAGTGDRLINGVRTEYKTIWRTQNPNADTLSGAIANRAMNARSQARHVVIDVRKQPDMTEAIVRRGIMRAYGADRREAVRCGEPPRIDTIRVILKDPAGNDADVFVLRS